MEVGSSFPRGHKPSPGYISGAILLRQGGFAMNRTFRNVGQFSFVSDQLVRAGWRNQGFGGAAPRARGMVRVSLACGQELAGQ